MKGNRMAKVIHHNAYDGISKWETHYTETGTLISISATQAIVEYSDGSRVVVTGTDLNLPTGNQTGFSYTHQSGSPIYVEITDVNIGVAELAGKDFAYIFKDDDNIIGSDFNDLLAGFEGNDYIYGNKGNDQITGGDGDDYLFGGLGDDKLYGGAGDDYLQENGGGDDLYDGGDGNDMISYANHANGVTIDLAANTVTGVGAGTDTIINFERAQGSDHGGDTLYGNADSNTLDGRAGDDYLHGRGGNDYLIGSKGNDKLYGNDGNDRLYGGAGDDILDGGNGNDYIVDALNNNTVSGGAGNDAIFIMSGINTIDGGADHDFLFGGINSDYLKGGAGNDNLFGDVSDIIGGSDRLDGGAGEDKLEGGVGADTFVFHTNDGKDIIADFDWKVFPDHFEFTAKGSDFQSGIDKIELAGFSSVNATNIMDSISDVDGNAVFSAEGTEITFNGLLENQLDASDFLFV